MAKTVVVDKVSQLKRRGNVVGRPLVFHNITHVDHRPPRSVWSSSCCWVGAVRIGTFWKLNLRLDLYSLYTDPTQQLRTTDRGYTLYTICMICMISIVICPRCAMLSGFSIGLHFYFFLEAFFWGGEVFPKRVSRRKKSTPSAR